ncbi:MAG: ATP phosphoribosyltransferase regulatory subunit [Anaerolinea sp.]|nr:ATP phosphoribosyltransferase regulatory subunit [Anaerolinea sp.]
MLHSRPIDHTNWLIDRLRGYMSQFGYQTLDTPIIDSADLFLTRAGDQIISRLFTFERLGRQLALRPEFTAAAAHTYVELDTEEVTRWQFDGAIFADDGGVFQKTSVGAELFGMSGVAADAEIVAMAAGGLEHAGISGWRVVIGHVGLMRQLIRRYGLDARTERFLLNQLHVLKEYGKQSVLDMLDRLLVGRNETPLTTPEIGDLSELDAHQLLGVLLDATQHGVTMGGRSRQDIVRRLLQKRQRAAERTEIEAALDFLEAWSSIIGDPETAFGQIERLLEPGDHDARKTLDSWRAMISLLEVYGIPSERTLIQPGLARNWDYYTGVVFEIHGTMLLAGGGRYDELARLIGGDRDIPSVGFAYYLDQLLAALPQTAERPSLVELAGSPVAAVRWACELRARGFKVAQYPDNSSRPGTLIVQPDGSLIFTGKRYRVDEIDRLVSDLEKSS